MGTDSDLDAPPNHCGPFRVSRQIDAGSAGSVWVGEHNETGVPAAIKIFDRTSIPAEAVESHLKAEVKALASLQHPNIVTLFDFGVVSEETAANPGAPFDAGTTYLAMEHADGGSVRAAENIETGFESWGRIQRVLLDILDALAYAHANDVVHRDIKPANILISHRSTPDARVDPDMTPRTIVTDFGLAQALRTSTDFETQHRNSDDAGTPTYMAPEQFRAEWRTFGPWTDLYSLGCVAYEIVTGEVPFYGDSYFEIASKHMTEEVESIHPQISIPGTFKDWILKLLAKDPNDRFQRAADAAAVLAKINSSTQLFSDGEADGGAPEQPQAGQRVTTTLSFAGDDLPLEDLFLDIDQYAPPPPLPESWRFELPERQSVQLLDTGLDVFGYRELPLVGQHAIRDELWSYLRDATDEGISRCVVLSGPEGIGKSQLARWLTARAHELGVGTPLSTFHGPGEGTETGLRRLFESFFSSWKLPRNRTHELLSDRLEQFGADEDGSDERLATALTEFLRPERWFDEEKDTPSYTFESVRDKFEWLARFVDRVAADRIPMLRLDNFERGYATLQWVNYLLSRDNSSAIFVILTLDGDTKRELDPDSNIGRLYEALTSHRETAEIEVEPLSDAARREFLGRSIRLEPDLAERVADASRGIPLYLDQLLRDWVDRRQLRSGADGFELVDEAATEFPADVLELVHGRIDVVTEAFEKRIPEINEMLLQAAAALGTSVSKSEWNAVCERLYSLNLSDQFVGTMVDAGIAHWSPLGWEFEHEVFRLALVERAKSVGRWIQLNELCASVLEELYAPQSADVLDRRAHHLDAAGDSEGARSLRKEARERRRAGPRSR